MRSPAMGLGAMLVFLVVAVVILPILVRYVNRWEVSGFQNMQETTTTGASDSFASSDSLGASVAMENAVTAVPSGMGASGQLSAVAGPLCRSPNNGDQPCPEGTFCDGVTQTCVSSFVGGAVPDSGYYA